MKIVLDSLINSRLLFQYLATATGCITFLSSGMHYGWASPSLPQLLANDSQIPMTSDDGSWVATMSVLGNIPGSILGGYASDAIGRRYSILLTAPIYFMSWIMVAFAPSKILLNIARFSAGIADGLIYTSFPMYIGEISDPNIRGLLGSCIQVSLVIGVLLINVIGVNLNIKYTALISSLFPVLHFLTFYFMPESPYYLIMRGKKEEAKESLQVFNRNEDIGEHFQRVSDAVEQDKQATGSIWDLFTVRSNRRAAVIVFGLRAFQQFSGIAAIMFYAKIIFQEASGDISANLSTIIYFIIQLVVSLLSSFLVDKTGRRPLLIFSIIGSAASLAAEGFYFFFENDDIYDTSLIYLPLIALLTFVVIFNIGMGTIPVLILGEFFPTNVKAFALCLADIVSCTTVSISAKFFQITRDDFGMHVPFFSFTVSCLLGLVFILFCVPETKGKTLEEIQEHLRGEHKKESDISME
ncbi:facilitated trehalose transporter Tret1-like [Aethina tumida]|uniref:facilitated trehalose transporter Tret1-like n=1 Tax=Aethina tumida TaxID=116153 RepID=UPI0021486437|nr:facilitated trehalose transporter Tret1-like [Aethina tumida]